MITDQGTHFTSNLIEDLVKEYEIKHKKSTPYHPQANGQVEVSNRELENILIKIVGLHRNDWANRLSEAIWAYKITWKTTTVFTPFKLIYGKKVVLPIEFKIKTLIIVIEVDIDLSSVQWARIGEIHTLDECKIHSLQHT